MEAELAKREQELNAREKDVSEKESILWENKQNLLTCIDKMK